MRESDRLRTLRQRIEPTDLELEVMVLQVAKELGRRPGAPFLWPLQAQAHRELQVFGQLVAPMAVGSGKTWVLGTAPTALMNYRARDVVGVGFEPPRVYPRTTIITKPSLIEQTRREIAKLRGWYEHIAPPECFQFIPYSQLSRGKGLDALRDFDPELVLADEAHLLANLDSNRTRRAMRYLLDHAQTFVPLSGTMTKVSCADYLHLYDLALGDDCPLPRNTMIDRWCSAIDSGTDPSRDDLETVAQALGTRPRVKSIRKAYRKRMRRIPGVVTSTEGALAMALEVHALTRMPPSTKARKAVRKLYDDWELPDGTLLVDAIEFARHAKTLALGFWNHYQPHKDEPAEKVTAYKSARSTWGALVRWALSDWAAERDGFDSPGLLGERGEAGELLGRMQTAWDTWVSVRNTVRWDKRIKWVDRELIGEVVDAWAAKLGGPGVVWYSSKGTETALRAAGIPVFGSGSEPPRPGCADIVACQTRVHGTGWNGQHFGARSLVLECSGSADVWEQLLGRQHRPGQRADGVRYDVAQWSPAQVRALRGVIRDSEYFEEVMGAKLKLTSYADLTGVDRYGARFVKTHRD